ncbi:MAG: two-component system regulatory protein YycI [Dethiobacter sp.]|nr:two-component system regulatory protein YycI [Dethiobacter sp.]
MDLSRAKTILIVSFLLLNIFLGLRLYHSPQYVRVRGGITGDEADLAREVLQNAGYEVSTVVPRQTPRLSLLHVSRPPVSGPFWSEKFWGDKGEITAVLQEGTLTLRKGGETVQISPGGMVVYLRPGAGEAAGEDGRVNADRFLRERNLLEDNLKFDLAIAAEDAAYLYRYLQTYRGFPLFSGYIDIRTSPEGIREARIYSILPIGFSEKELRVISAAAAVNTLVKQPGAFIAKKIVDISLGYYSQHYDAERWEIAPVWRFAASDGSVFYVNAFTGEAEAEN